MALVRVKRHLTDDPADALLVTSKKLKIDEDLLTTVFKFAATVKKEEEISSALKRVLARDSKFKDEVTNVTKISEKMRAENRIQSANNRLKVVNCFRSLDYGGEGENSVGESSRPLTVLHAESSLPAMDSCTLTRPIKEGDDDYVFDLYFTSSLDICDSTMESIISAVPVENEFMFDNYRGEGSDEFYDCDEDSNEENYWKNDYPDEDEDKSYSSIDEDDMRMAAHGIKKMVVDSDGELKMASSSEDEDDDWIYDEGALPSREYVFGDSDDSDQAVYRHSSTDSDD